MFLPGQKRRQSDSRGREWSDVATNHGMLEGQQASEVGRDEEGIFPQELPQEELPSHLDSSP